jgi:predicted ferric reductase
VPPLAILLALVVLSIPYIRHRVYEAFYYTHVILAITYLGLLFWHAGNILDSWAYLWATLALWLASWLARLFWYTKPMNLQQEWFSGAPTSLVRLQGGMTKLQVLAPENFGYTPGQHCFLRFPELSMVDNHPFTLASALAATRMEDNCLTFLVRTHSGFTRRLASYCQLHPDQQLSAWVDGPYGGVGRRLELLYDELVLIAGGSGITACLPWLDQAVRVKETRVRRVVLLWSVTSEEHLSWIHEFLSSVLAAARHDTVIELRFHVTRGVAAEGRLAEGTSISETKAPAMTESSFSQAGDKHISMNELGQLKYGRPDLKHFIPDNIRGPKTFIIGCGPEGIRIDLSNAVAGAQSKVIHGDVLEVGLHLEAFE